MEEWQPHHYCFPQLLTEEVCRHFSLRNNREGEWLVTSGLHLALHPDRSCIAISFKNEVAVFVLQPGDVAAPEPFPTLSRGPSHDGHGRPGEHASARSTGDPRPSLPHRLSSAGHSHASRASSMSRHQLRHGSLLGCSTTGDADVTCIDWVQLPPPIEPRASTQVTGQPELGPPRRTTDASSAGGDSKVAAGEAVLIVCDSHGHLSLHDEHGKAMFRQRLHTGALTHLDTHAGGQRHDDRGADAQVTITSTGCVFQITWQQLSATWAACEAAEARAAKKHRQGVLSSVLSWGEASIHEQVPAIPHQRWDLPRQLRRHSHALYVGSVPPDVYSMLRNAFNPQGGASPCLALLELRVDKAARSTLGAALGAGIGLAADIISVARNASTGVVQGPGAITRGIKNFIMAPLLLSPPRPGRGAAPLVTHPDLQGSVASVQPTPSVRAELHDPPRRTTWLSRAPHGPYLVSADSLGRVMLIDSTNLMALRMWKGYRDAQCGWIELPSACVHPAADPRAALHQLHRPDPGDGLPGLQFNHLLMGRPGSHAGSTASHQSGGEPAAQVPESVMRSQDGESEGYASMHVDAAQLPLDDAVPRQEQGVEQVGQSSAVRRIVEAGRVVVLVVYAPRRQVVEWWAVPHGPCLLSLPVSSYCQLMPVVDLSVAHPSWSDVMSEDGSLEGLHVPARSCSCVLLDGVTGQLQDLAAVAESFLTGWA